LHYKLSIYSHSCQEAGSQVIRFFKNQFTIRVNFSGIQRKSIMKKKFAKWILVGLLVISMTACSSATPTVDSNTLATMVALDVQLTQVAATMTSMVEAESATPLVTNTPIPTETPTPEPTVTPTLSGVWLTFSTNTNCRSGAGTYYPIIMTVNAGSQVQAIANSSDGQFYYVRVIDTSTHYCWVWSQTASYVGNPNVLPQYTSAPTNTPTLTPTVAAGFTVTYNSLTSCSPNYALVLTIKNNGYMTWQSIKITIVDSTTGSTLTHTSDLFTGYSSCTIAQQQEDLTTGEYGMVSNYSPGEFSYNPTGHSLAVTVSLYSQNGLSGTVMSQTIGVTP
jgi:uncharacterized protein YgiM (DUF1202 family)